eukprot:8799113-Pyramimonas_sp.AAC.1
MGSAIKRARESLANSFADRVEAPLQPDFNGEALGRSILDAMNNLLSVPAFAVVLYLVCGLHPREFSLVGAPQGSRKTRPESL